MLLYIFLIKYIFLPSHHFALLHGKEKELWRGADRGGGLWERITYFLSFPFSIARINPFQNHFPSFDIPSARVILRPRRSCVFKEQE